MTERAMGARGVGLAVAFGIAAGAAPVDPLTMSARADVSSAHWMQFGSSGPAHWNQPFDRSQAREWEANPETGEATLSRDNIAPMKDAIKRYAKIVSKGGWKKLPKGKLQRGQRGPAVELLRARLEASGDLVAYRNARHVFDSSVETAVKRFQMRHGLTPSGKIDRATRNAMNVPARARLRQLRTNLSRISSLSRAASKKKYVLVNIPAAQIEAVSGGEVVSRHAAVVGKADRRTPILRSSIHAINFNPIWTLPPTVIRKDLIPKGRSLARRGKDVLSVYGIDAYSNGRKLTTTKINWHSSAVYNYTYRQSPGPDNPMGFVKINFHNNHAVYLHDTPSKSLFGRNFRAASSGCVRVRNVEQLVSWLLEDNGGWSVSRVADMKESGARKDVNLKRGVPLYMAYITAWVGQDGIPQFRRDLYRRDGVGALAAAY